MLSLMSLDSSFVLPMVSKVEMLECDCVDRWLLYSYITVDTGVLGNELRLGVLLNGKRIGLWEPELLLVGRGSNTYFRQKYDNKCITFI